MHGQQLRINRFKIPADNIDWCKTAETLNFNSGKITIILEKEARVIVRFLSALWRKRNRPHGIQIGGAAQVLEVGLGVRPKSGRRARCAENALEIPVDLCFSPW